MNSSSNWKRPYPRPNIHFPYLVLLVLICLITILCSALGLLGVVALFTGVEDAIILLAVGAGGIPFGIVAIIFWRFVRSGVYLSPKGVLVRGILSTRIFSWNKVDGIIAKNKVVLGGSVGKVMFLRFVDGSMIPTVVYARMHWSNFDRDVELTRAAIIAGKSNID